MNVIKLPLLIAIFITVSLGIALADTIKVSIPDMECEHCSKSVEDRLKLEKDITKISIDLKERVATIYTVDSVKVSDEKIRELIKDAGFEAKSIERIN